MRSIEFGKPVYFPQNHEDKSPVEVDRYELTENDKRNFEFIFQGFIIGGHISKEKNILILKRELSILDKLEGLSKDCECGRLVPGTQEPDRELIGGTLWITDREFDTLYNYIGSVPWSTGKSVRHAVGVLELLKNATQTSDPH